MRWAAIFALTCFSLNAVAQTIEVRSPDHAYTYAYGTVFSHQLDRDPLTNELIARVTFSNYPCATDHQPRQDETFDFRFPGLRFDRQRRQFYAYALREGWIPLAEYRPNLPYGGYELSPFAQVILMKRSGHVTAILAGSPAGRDGAKWVQVDDNFSLQKLLAIGLDYLTR